MHRPCQTVDSIESMHVIPVMVEAWSVRVMHVFDGTVMTLASSPELGGQLQLGIEVEIEAEMTRWADLVFAMGALTQVWSTGWTYRWAR